MSADESPDDNHPSWQHAVFTRPRITSLNGLMGEFVDNIYHLYGVPDPKELVVFGCQKPASNEMNTRIRPEDIAPEDPLHMSGWAPPEAQPEVRFHAVRLQQELATWFFENTPRMFSAEHGFVELDAGTISELEEKIRKTLIDYHHFGIIGKNYPEPSLAEVTQVLEAEWKRTLGFYKDQTPKSDRAR